MDFDWVNVGWVVLLHRVSMARISLSIQHRDEKSFVNPQGGESLEFSSQEGCGGTANEYIQYRIRGLRYMGLVQSKTPWNFQSTIIGTSNGLFYCMF